MVRVKSVEPLHGFVVRLTFTDGSERILDFDPLMHGPIFTAIRSVPQMFRAVTVDDELGTIVWPNGADMDPDVLHGDYASADGVRSER